MHKLIKYGLLTLGAVGVLLVGGVIYISATFNPNEYKPFIIQAVKDKKQRTLKLDGDIKMFFFPSIGADLGKVSLSEFKSDKEFVAIDSVRVSLALLPLLSKQVVVNELGISGLKASLLKFKSGKTNIDDLLGEDDGKPQDATKNSSGKPPLRFDIASVRVEKAELNYHDENTGALYSLKDFNLKTGHIANGVPTKVDIVALIQASQPKLNIATQLKAMLTFDLDKQLYKAAELDLQAKGTALDIENLVVKISGNASANLATQEFFTNQFVVAATGAKGKDNFDIKLDAPALNLAKNKLSGNSVLTLELAMKQPEQTFNAKLSSPVTGNFELQQFNLPDLTVTVNATGDKLPNKAISSQMKGNMQVDAKHQSVQASLAGGLLQSQVKAKLAMNNFANPSIRFDVDVDQFDADLFLPKKSQEKEISAKVKGDLSAEQPFDLSALKTLNLEGGLRIGRLKAANVKTSQLRLDVKAHNGMVNFNPLSANLYQGSMSGSITVNATQAVPSFIIDEKLSGINISPLLNDAANFDMLEGKGSVALNLKTQGNTVNALKKTLNGSIALNLTDGAVKGINIAKTLRSAGNMLGKQSQTQAASQDEKTDFSEMKASFKVNNGVAHNDDLSLKSPLVRLSGNGDIDIGNSNISYLLKTTLTGTLQGQGGKDSVSGLTVPVRLAGPFSALKYTVDFGAMVSDTIKQKVQTEIKTKLQDQLKGGLNSLFK